MEPHDGLSGDITQSIKGYNFIVNSVWPEIVSAVQNNLISIFAPGDPDAFHKVCGALELLSFVIYNTLEKEHLLMQTRFLKNYPSLQTAKKFALNYPWFSKLALKQTAPWPYFLKFFAQSVFAVVEIKNKLISHS